MKHDDFNNLEVENVMAKTLAACQQKTKAASVHWISTFGIARVQESSDENWMWTFSTADIMGNHVISQPKKDMFDLFHLWKKVSQLYPKAPKGKMAPQMMGQDYVHPLMFDGALVGMLLFEGLPGATNPVQLHNALREDLEIAVKYIAFSYQMMEAKNMSYLDEVTGLYNQRYLPMVLEHEIHRNKRDKAVFSLLFLDIDYFKMVNDGRGHWVGSRLLLELGKILKSQVRSCDYLFRYGGDEFIVLLGNSNAENSKKVAERIRKAVEGHTFSVEGHNLNLTVSIGLAAYPEHAQSAAGLIQIADQAMYYGKRKSRNIVFVAS